MGWHSLTNPVTHRCSEVLFSQVLIVIRNPATESRDQVFLCLPSICSERVDREQCTCVLCYFCHCGGRSSTVSFSFSCFNQKKLFYSINDVVKIASSLTHCILCMVVGKIQSDSSYIDGNARKTRMRLIPDSHHCPLSTAAYTVYLLHVCSLCSPLFEWLAATVTQGSIARYLSITLIQPIQPAPGRPHKPLTLIYIKPGSTSVISTQLMDRYCWRRWQPGWCMKRADVLLINNKMCWGRIIIKSSWVHFRTWITVQRSRGYQFVPLLMAFHVWISDWEEFGQGLVDQSPLI